MNSTKTSCIDKSCADTRCADTRCADTRCADTRCSYKSCRSFIKPKTYNKEEQQIISSLRNLNKKLIESVKKKEQECIMIKEETQQFIQENRRIIQENQRLIQENVRLEELGKTYLRTYTNMTIQLLILEEKVAKFEGRSW
jgi:uncharacterized protein YktB (UPF0637 family)